MENTNKFESWFNKINEDLAQEPTINTDATSVAEPAVAEKPTDRDAMMHDIDTIMTSLETLASELKEELESFDAEELNEAGDSVAKKFMDFTIRAPKARKAQAKVNKFKLKISDLEDTATGASGDTKKKLDAKVTTMKKQADELQSAVDDKIKDKGEIVQRAQKSEKIKGQIEVLKNKMGEAGSKDKAQDIKQQAQKLKKRLQDEEAALKSMEPEKKEEPKKEEPKKKEPKNSEESPKEEPKKKEATTEAPAEEPKKKEATTEEPKATTTTAEAPKEEPKNEDPKVKELKKEIESLEKDLESANPKQTSAKGKQGVEILKGSIAAKKKELEKLTAQESLIVRALDANLNELAEEIASKLEWQLTEGTALHTKYNTIIRKAENDNQLNERLHVSVKDRFRNLL